MEQNKTHVFVRIAILPMAVSAVLLALIIVLSIRWPSGHKILGDEYTAHIYSNDSFRLLTSDFEDNYSLMIFRHDNHHDDSYTFKYDKESDSYLIYIDIRGSYLYLTADENNNVYMSDSPDADGCRWIVQKHENTMYYRIINCQNNMVLYEADNLYAQLMPYDESSVSELMRLQ